MSMPRANAVPRVPTPPTGVEIARYPTYLEAQKAVDFLSDKHFAVENVTIVGEGLQAVERITGRLTYSRVAVAGLASGAWFGLFVGLLLSLFGGGNAAATIVAAIGIGAAFGVLFGLISYALTGNQRDFTSQSQIVATSYAILCVAERAGEARQVLSELGLGQPGAARPAGPAAPRPAQPPTTPGASGWTVPPSPTPTPGAPAHQPPAQPAPTPTPVSPRFQTPTGEPRYGRRLEDVAPPAAQSAPEPAAPQAQQAAAPAQSPAPQQPTLPEQPTTPAQPEPAAPVQPAQQSPAGPAAPESADGATSQDQPPTPARPEPEAGSEREEGTSSGTDDPAK
ncbi:general stress protein [Luteimicrobium sp. NPDC057192]|uniref:general stress protein n=1 Tax=Luteimicrobium sp. NPDC057192 TaxID=3346042 RepID=UPI0036367F13